ncbi:MAG: hypothetical protein IPP71_23325 [Bacteroidetes bacterium]|nr:hypothetical protein [Bacteroidota bacterium]
MIQLNQYQQNLLHRFNQTDAIFPSESCLPQLFEKQCDLTPDAIAVEFNGDGLSYQQLNQKPIKFLLF